MCMHATRTWRSSTCGLRARRECQATDPDKLTQVQQVVAEFDVSATVLAVAGKLGHMCVRGALTDAAPFHGVRAEAARVGCCVRLSHFAAATSR